MAVVQKWGNSLAVRVPRPLAEQLGLHDGSEVNMAVEGTRLVIERPQRRRVTLRQLLKDADLSRQHSMVDWGPDLGGEVIE